MKYTTTIDIDKDIEIIGQRGIIDKFDEDVINDDTMHEDYSL